MGGKKTPQNGPDDGPGNHRGPPRGEKKTLFDAVAEKKGLGKTGGEERGFPTNT